MPVYTCMYACIMYVNCNVYVFYVFFFFRYLTYQKEAMIYPGSIIK